MIQSFVVWSLRHSFLNESRLGMLLIAQIVFCLALISDYASPDFPPTITTATKL
jgi:hypothetical protein